MHATIKRKFSGHPISRRSGFTLIEITCVIVILAIAAAIVVAGMSSQGDLQAESALRQVMADLLYAQNQAIATQQPIYVYFDTTHHAYTLYNATPWGSGTTVTNPISHNAYSDNWSSSSWSISSVALDGSANQPALYFDALGAPHSCNSSGASGATFTSAGTVVVASGGATVTITIQPNTGDITVQ